MFRVLAIAASTATILAIATTVYASSAARSSAEPASLVLLGTALFVIGARVRRRSSDDQPAQR